MTVTDNTHISPTVLKLPAVLEQTALSRSMVYELMDASEFPKSIKLGKRAVGWLASEVNAWIEQRANERGE